MGATRRRPRFVGRVEELRVLEERLRDAVSGAPRMVLLRGDAGIGKTRLLREFSATARGAGVHVCVGRCYQDLTFPYRPFAEALQTLLEQLPHERPEDSRVLEGLVRPGDAASLPEAGASADPGQREMARMFFAVSRVAVRLAQDCPILLVLEDLHWADHPSLDLLDHLVHAISDAGMGQRVPLMLVGSHRAGEVGPRLERTLARLSREEMVHVLELPALDESEIRRLVGGMGLGRASNRLVTTVRDVTGGNPLFIESVMEHLVEGRSGSERVGPGVAASELHLPVDLTAAVARRADGLSPERRGVLTLASFLGDRFPIARLRDVCNLPEADLAELLADARDRKLLAGENGIVEFTHPSVRQVFYNEPSEKERRRIHARIGATLRDANAADPDAHVMEVAHHLVRAGPAAPPEDLVTFARRAGDEALGMLAWSEAARYYEAAAAAAGRADRLPAAELADLHFRAGLSRYRELDAGACFESYDRALEVYRDAGDLRGRAQVIVEKTRAQLTQAAVSYGVMIDVEPMSEILDALGASESLLRGRILAQLSQAHWAAQQPEQAEDLARQALALGREIDDDRLCIDAHLALALAQIQRLEIREALETYRETISHTRKIDDAWIRGWPLPRIPMPLFWLGRLDEAESAAVEASDATLETRDWAEYSLSLATLVMVAAARGDTALAEEQARRSMTAVDRSSYPWGAALMLPALACARAQVGATAEAEDALALLVEPERVFADPGPLVQVLVSVYRELLRSRAGPLEPGDQERVVNLARAVKLAGNDATALGVACALVEVADEHALPAVAEILHPTLELALERGVVFTTGWVFLLPRVLGLSAALLGRHDAAEAHFARALRVAEEARAEPELGRTCLDLARVLARRGRAGDRQRLVESLARAGAIFDELGLEPWRWRCDELAGELHADLSKPGPRPAAFPDHLGAREVEVLVRAARGQLPDEIGAALLLGSETVARHLGTIRAKIGAESRDAVTSYAFEKGLLSDRPAGAALAADAPRPVETRLERPVVILVTDMAGFTELVRRLGDAEAQRLIRTHNFLLRGTLRRHGGLELQHTGDGIMAHFASATRAVECAVELQYGFARHTRAHPEAPLRVRVGLHAGQPLPEEDRLFGAAVIAAHRICALADAEEILVSEAVRALASERKELFSDRGHFALKGFAEKFQLFEVEWGGADRPR